ncbi:hypothetical protein PsAD13_04979 [Pseudovibrio sp. Ad13]|uniref:HEPN/Toprim-associated domain-containing protein n=1 Tax=Pseudovibrio sp. Ad13 TaxID=989396 RepID=UPI0007AEDCA8|nr:HEPN/Toprim-associated domain-containing protein [Pseudovibrio sp. Ad13]KZK79988.1 hypothetical protein PsAD13_04979 [Pseudovibrio sp. Ad13]
MGSYCELRFDDLYIDTWKSSVPDDMISLFQENERLVVPDEEDPEAGWDSILYEAQKEDVLLRLELMGITLENSKAAFQEWHTAKLYTYKEWVADGSDWAAETLKALEKFSLDEWMRRCRSVIKKRYSLDRDEEPEDEVERQMLDTFSNESWLFFSCDDVRFVYRLILEACSDVELISLDVSALVGGGYYDEGFCLIAEARKPDALKRSILEPVVIMAEGKTDMQVLKASLTALYPNVSELFSFFDHDTLNVDGGASFLLKFLKAFAAARTPMKILALFDNDAAGRLEFEKIKQLTLPSNIRALCLPEIELGRSYPTVGPQGVHTVDVNGDAVGIEMFMGRHNLCNERGELLPIRWTHYFSKAQSYQGEISEKERVQKAFFADIAVADNSVAARERFPELNLLWLAIFDQIK